MRCDIAGRGGSRDELSANGPWFGDGVSWKSVKASESRSLAELRRRVRCARACSSSESESESESTSPVRLARACATPSSEEVVEYPVIGRATGTRTSGVLTAVLSLLKEEELPEPLDCVLRSTDFFLVMLSARTGPS
jgi:hypothetical protein